MARRKLIVVSNRGPVTFGLDADGNRVAGRGGGGLVTALRSLVDHHDVTWIASALSDEDRAVAEEAGGDAVEETAREGSPYRLHLVAHDPIAYDRHYNVISNPMLWFIQHYLWGLASSPDVDDGVHTAWAEGYVPANRNFADAVVDELERQPDADVFLHDYHLYLAPRFVRERAPDATMAHFVHVPWPMPEYWRVLPDSVRRALHKGLLASDVVGFHTHRWRRNFLMCCEDILDDDVAVDWDAGEVQHRGRVVSVRVHPISVDPQEFDEIAGSAPVLEAEREIEETRPEHLVLRVDRTDPSKNVVRGLRAYELLLEAHSELHGRVQMLALLNPSRQDIPEYAEYLGAIERAARALNARFQQEGWVPLELSIQDDFPQSVAAYKQFDVLLVNAIFDGLNLVAKEAPLVNTRGGVVILSENAGAHEELGEWALSVNPFDVAGQAEALHTALTMPVEERRARLEGIERHVREHDIRAWIDAQLRDLDEAHERAGTTLSA